MSPSSKRKTKKKVLVLCTGNSCRSIMAEFLINHYLGEHWQACSAGVSPSRPQPWAIRTLEDEGIDTSGARSKSVSEFWDRDDLDLVITVCDHAKETCPAFYKPVPMLHISIEDPVKYSLGDDEAARAHFRECADTIMSKIITKLKDMTTR